VRETDYFSNPLTHYVGDSDLKLSQGRVRLDNDAKIIYLMFLAPLAAMRIMGGTPL